MSKSFLLLIGLCFLLTSGLTAQEVNNGSLETWEYQQSGQQFEVKENPKGWTSRNHTDPNPQTVFCYSTMDSYDGEKAAVLQNVYPSPGICLSSFLSLGIFNEDSPEDKGGISFQEKPIAMHFAYKYLTTDPNPSGFYTAKAIIRLTKWNSETKSQLVIGEGKYEISHKSNFYNEIEVPVEYFSNQDPDSLQIIFSTPNNPDDQIRFTIDDIHLQMNTTVGNNDRLDLGQVNLFPNPVNDWLSFYLPSDVENTELLVFNSVGQLLINEDLKGTGGKINCQNLHPGMYFYQIRQSKELVKSGKIMKASL